MRSVKSILSHSAEKFGSGTHLCFRHFRVSKDFTPKKEITGFSAEKLLCHSAEKFRSGTF